MGSYPKFVGVDGCPAGWVCVSYCKSDWEVKVFSTIQDLWDYHSDAELILIDIPIGLRDKGSEARLCDAEARNLLKKRSSSVFPTPCRAVLSEELYEKANEVNREITGKGLSKQSWNITPKIKEVDILVREIPNGNEIIIESHPELCFMALSGGEPMKNYKKTQDGITERIQILKKHVNISLEILKARLYEIGERNAVIDDIFDAVALAISASFGLNSLKFIPEEYEYDSEGLPMRMAIPFQGST